MRRIMRRIVFACTLALLVVPLLVVAQGKGAKPVTPEYDVTFTDNYGDKIHSDGKGAYPGARLNESIFSLTAYASQGRSIIFQFNDPSSYTYGETVACRSWETGLYYTRPTPPYLLAAVPDDRVPQTVWADLGTSYEMVWNGSAWVRIIAKKKGDFISYKYLNFLAMPSGTKAYVIFGYGFDLVGYAGDATEYTVNHNNNFDLGLIPGRPGAVFDAGIAEVEAVVAGWEWKIRPLPERFPVLSGVPTVQNQANHHVLVAASASGGLGTLRCDLGNFYMPFELTLRRVK